MLLHRRHSQRERERAATGTKAEDSIFTSPGIHSAVIHFHSMISIYLLLMCVCSHYSRAHPTICLPDLAFASFASIFAKTERTLTESERRKKRQKL